MAVIVVGARDLVSRVSRRYGRVSWFLSAGVVLFAGAIAAIYGAGRLSVGLSGPAEVFVDGRSVGESPRLRGERWHSVLVRGSPGLRLTRLALSPG